MKQVKILKSTVADTRDVFAGATESVTPLAAYWLVATGFAEYPTETVPDAPAGDCSDATPASAPADAAPAADVTPVAAKAPHGKHTRK